jgi:leader peptidase (prepilin peptidase)/N-methyltransferase
MGGGDAWLLAAIGAFTGPILLIPVLFLASVQGVVFGLVRLRLSGPPPAPSALADDDDDGWEPDPHAIPFGPFLALGALETLFFGGACLRLLHFDYRVFTLP